MALIIDNDDCLTHILEYLPSSEIWLIIHAAPNILRNHQLYRCAWEALRKRGAPFTLANSWHDWTGNIISLEDRSQQFVANVERLDLFHRSDIHELVAKAEIDCQFTATGSCPSPLTLAEIDGRWLDLLLPLPGLKSLALLRPTHHAIPGLTYIQGNTVALTRLPVDLAPLLPKLTSFGVRLDRDHLRPEERASILQMIGQMVDLKSLEIPTNLLAAIVNRMPEMAHRLRELKIYQAAIMAVPCDDVIGMIASGSFPELRQLQYRHAYDSGENTCKLDVANLGALTQLRTFSVDCWQLAPSANLAAGMVSLQNVHLHVTMSDANAGTLHLVISRFSALRQISFHIDTSYYWSKEHLHRWLIPLLSASNVAASLRELRITEPGTDRESRNGCSFLIGCLKSCRQLELVDMSCPVVSLTGFANHARGGPRRFEPCKGLRAIVDELASMPSIKNVRFVAKIDSICAVRAALPGNAKIIDFQMKPREAAAYPRSVALLPGEEFVPIRLLIRGQKDGLIPKQDTNYSDKFYIRIVAL